MSDATDPTTRNRLGEEESPYLRQHADNPVNWQPWDEAALEAARERDVPIFLSIGYSACHWCHVMEEESFEDEGIAELLNDEFVPIKVDREERPDLDSIYMSICQQVTGSGGWPLSAWLTPEGDPFYVGTYFPPEAKRGQPGFEQLLQDIAGSWADPEDREGIEDRAQQWTAAIEGDLEETPDQPASDPDEAILKDAASAALRAADREHGGFGRGGPKFPQPGRLHLLLRAHDRTGREECREVVTETLDAMVSGGLYDHVGGGFHRYCTDRDWTVPHFEKMLYDNGEIPRALLAGYQVTGEERYATAVEDSIAFLDRELGHPDGGFYSTLDARSLGPEDDPDTPSHRGEEGAFYVWTPEAVHDAVDDERAAELFCDRFGISAPGNFEGQTVLTLSAPVDALAEEYGMTEGEVEAALETAREQAFEARAGRPRPGRDEKVLAGWNGLVVSMLAEAGIVLDVSHAERGAAALSFVRERLWDDEAGRLARRYKDGDVKGEGYLEDYAFLGRGALDLYGATGDVEHLAFALDLARAIRREFWDADAGTLYFTPDSGENLVARPQELGDQSTPSSAGVAVQLLTALDHFVPHEGFDEVAAGVLATNAAKLDADPLKHTSLVLAADERQRGVPEVTVAADEVPDEWRAALGETYLPGRLLAPRPPTAEGLQTWLDRLDLDAAPPVWADREARDDEPTVYACRQFTCSPPQHDVDAALDWLRENA